MNKILLLISSVTFIWLIVTTNPSDVSLVKLLLVLSTIAFLITFIVREVTKTFHHRLQYGGIIAGVLVWTMVVMSSANIGGLREAGFLIVAVLLVRFYVRQNFLKQ